MLNHNNKSNTNFSIHLIRFEKNSYLDNLRNLMNAPLISTEEFYRMIKIPVNNFVESQDQEFDFINKHIKTGDDDILLNDAGNPVTLHIKHPIKSYQTGQYSDPKIHIFECNTLKKMIKDGRLNRYVLSEKADRVRKVVYDKAEKYVELYICQNCLSKINWGRFSKEDQDKFKSLHKSELAKVFDLKVFFEVYKAPLYDRSQNLRYENAQTKANEYSKDWKEISYQYRASKNWQCESCGTSFVHNKGELHTHHIDGNKSNNHRYNLRALCYTCHSQQPYHDHMKR